MRFLFLLLFILPCSVFSQSEEFKFSLYFENDEYELTEGHHALLKVIKQLEAKDERDVHIKGYTNSIGTENYNLGLSQRRAQSVKAELREFTIISSMGYGELQSAAPDNRRVDVFVHYKKDHVPMEGEIVEPPQLPEPAQQTIASLVEPKKGDKVILQGIMFYQDRDVIMDESKEALQQLVDFLKRNPKVKFKLIGHICCGDPMLPARDLFNVRTGKKNLSEARAKAVHNYLAKKGIDTRRMRYLGMAFRQSTGKGDEFDRRVEIEITSVD